MCAIQGKCLIVKVSKVVLTPLALSPNFLLEEISSYAVVPWEVVFLTTSFDFIFFPYCKKIVFNAATPQSYIFSCNTNL
ncbi:unknown [Mycoplasma sp. CAG:611]|nr:unknown [Mycoplasma sp. CAG:611]